MDGSRRTFLKSTTLGFVALGLPPSFLVRAAGAQQSGRGKALVVVFQRGGMDGLNVVVPFKDQAYYILRPSIAVAEPAAGEERGLDLDGYFALHPALAPLKTIYDKGQLAIVHAAGSPDNTRSHFDAQDYMELGTPGNKSAGDGWLNRFLQTEPEADATPFRAVAFSSRMPRTLQGAAPALALDDLRGFKLRGELVAQRDGHMPS